MAPSGLYARLCHAFLVLLSSYVPACNYMVPIPKIKDCSTKSMSYYDFHGIAISPIL